MTRDTDLVGVRVGSRVKLRCERVELQEEKKLMSSKKKKEKEEEDALLSEGREGRGERVLSSLLLIFPRGNQARQSQDSLDGEKELKKVPQPTEQLSPSLP